LFYFFAFFSLLILGVWAKWLNFTYTPNPNQRQMN
jgi:hypothetical protein